ncbi:MAG: HDOD domain-containing protein, partial [Bryobacteraceae bacterium]
MKRILFVDDEPRILDGLQKMLQPHEDQWEMAFAPGGQAGLAMMEAASFDVIVSDMRMPGMDGAELMRLVRERHPNAVRIILSSQTELESAYRAVPVAHQFLLKPCDPDALGIAIERATSLFEVLNSKMLATMLGSMQELPSLPRTYYELRETLAKPDVSLEEIEAIVEQDIAISAKILQLVNSAFFGVRREISTVKMAVSFMGLDILQNLVLSVEVFRAYELSQFVPGFSFEALQRHSQLTAQIAARLEAGREPAGTGVVTGLLHDLGELVLAERTPAHFARAIEGAHREHCPLYEAEEKLIGISHAEVGAYLLSLWGLPCPIVEAVAHHHHPQRVPSKSLDTLAIVHIADVLADEIESGKSHSGRVDAPAISMEYLESLGVAGKLDGWREMAQAAAK